MFSSRVKFAMRALMRSKTYSALNIVGLAIALSVSIVVFLYLKSELSYDEHYPGHEKIFRVHSDFILNDQEQRVPLSSVSLGPMLKADFPYIKNFTRLDHIEANILFKYRDRKYYENNIAIADSSYFEVFELDFIEGNKKTALNKPHSIVVSESFARRYFGEVNPVGKVISTNNFDYTITGLIEDIPANSHHHFDALISFFYQEQSPEERQKTLWNTTVFTFLSFNNPDDAQRLEAEFPAFYEEYMLFYGEKFDSHYQLQLERIDRIHFAGSMSYDRPAGNKMYLYAFGAIGGLILVLACINYVNMATARGMRRSKEAGIRRMMGSSKNGIRLLIFTESVLLALLSLFLAFVLVELVLHLTPFNAIVQKDLSLDFIRYPELWWYPLLLALVVGFLSGWYPAVTLSKVTALSAVQGGFSYSPKSVRVRKFLVGFQFCVSVAVVITALLMYRQMDYVRQKDLGYNKEDILLIPIQDSVVIDQLDYIRAGLEKNPHVISAALAMTTPGSDVNKGLMNVETRKSCEFEKRLIDNIMVGINYLETMGIELIEGRPFAYSDTLSGASGVMVNQRFVEEMGWEQPLGKTIRWGFDETGDQLFEGKVIAVVRDFNSHSLHSPIEPTLIYLQREQKGVLHVRVDSENLVAAIDDMEDIFARIDRQRPFQFSFLNKDLMRLYDDEHRQSRLILYLTYLAIFISFLGLTGLASFTTSLRTREIGLRKVLGADVYQMVNLIFKDMLILVVISVLLAIPLAYLLIRGWLSNFAYAANLDPLIFFFTAMVAVLLAYLIVSYHSIRVARSSPVDTLKYE